MGGTPKTSSIHFNGIFPELNLTKPSSYYQLLGIPAMAMDTPIHSHKSPSILHQKSSIRNPKMDDDGVSSDQKPPRRGAISPKASRRRSALPHSWARLGGVGPADGMVSMCLNGGFHQWGIPQNGWVIVENPLQVDDEQGYPYDYGNLQITIPMHPNTS